jgi:Right handed beta helix region
MNRWLPGIRVGAMIRLVGDGDGMSMRLTGLLIIGLVVVGWVVVRLTSIPTTAPTAAPTSAPTAAPTATPKPTSTPAPTPAPTPASGTVNVPNSIDASGGSDVSGALASFIGGLPDGTKIAFKSGGTYKLGKSIHLTNRHDLVFDGNGATLRISGCGVEDSAFVLDGKPSTGIKIRQFKIIGDNTAAGTAKAFVAGCESQMGVAIYGARDIDISDMTISSVHAECVYIDAGGNPRGVGPWADGITFRDSTCRLNGRMGVAIIAGSHVIVKGVTFERIAISVFDIEPYMADGGASDVQLTDNVIDGYGASPTYTGWVLEGSAFDMTTTIVHDITLARNRIIDGATKSANTVTTAGLAIKLRTQRWRQITVSDNVSTVSGNGPAMYFEHINGLTVSGNSQPLSSGTLVWFDDVSG